MSSNGPNPSEPLAAADYNPQDGTPWQYIPTKYICIIFVVLFSLSTLLHIFQLVRYRKWWMGLTVVLCGVGEILGWSGRLWGNISPNNILPFLIQISTLIFSPTFLIAANFIIFGRIINFFGRQYSRLSPRMYTIIFLSFDVAALIPQAVGGGVASSAETPSQLDLGAKIMLGGIVAQMIMMVIFVVFLAEYSVRSHFDRPLRSAAVVEKRRVVSKKLKIIYGALLLCMFFLFVRAIYRTIELGQGWNGSVMRTEWMFDVFDATMIVLAMWTYNFIHPGRFLVGDEHTDPNSQTSLNA